MIIMGEGLDSPLQSEFDLSDFEDTDNFTLLSAEDPLLYHFPRIKSVGVVNSYPALRGRMQAGLGSVSQSVC